MVHTYLCGEDILHREYMDFGINGERRLDLRAHQCSALNLGELVDLSANSGDSLECHVACRPVRADIRLIIIDRKYTVLDCGTDKAICLTVPATE